MTTSSVGLALQVHLQNPGFWCGGTGTSPSFPERARILHRRRFPGTGHTGGARGAGQGKRGRRARQFLWQSRLGAHVPPVGKGRPAPMSLSAFCPRLGLRERDSEAWVTTVGNFGRHRQSRGSEGLGQAAFWGFHGDQQSALSRGHWL